MERVQAGFAVAARASLRKALAGLVGAMLGILLMAGLGQATAGEVKLNAPCDQLKTTDVTKVDNPACRAISAIYIDENGKTIYFERLELDSKRRVAGRLVEVIRGCPENDPNCGGSCGKPSCTICIGGRCGCLC